MLTQELKQHVSLYFCEGGSNKEYHANLEPVVAGWVVTFAYGRRGSTMTTGAKTAAPVEYQKAKSIYDKLVREKTAKGYTPGADGALYTHSTAEVRDTAVRPQLLNEVDGARVNGLINDSAWGMQEKFDGRRMMVKKSGNNVIGINRKGLSVVLPAPVANAAWDNKNDGEFVIDGESVGDLLYAFDILSLGGRDLRESDYAHRYDILCKMHFGDAIRVVPLAAARENKLALYNAVRVRNGEGVVFKRLDARYTAGRPATGGDQLKYKFYAAGSFVVSRVNAKRSVGLEVYIAGRLTAIGNVTIPPNQDIPAVGDIVEIRYLYCFKGGSLYQPTYLMKRDDIDRQECVEAQIKYKAGGADEEDN